MLILGALVVALLVVLPALILPDLIGADEDPQPPTPTATAPDPIERKKPSELVKALPDKVADYIVTAQQRQSPHNPTALETWQLTYTGTADAITVQMAVGGGRSSG